MENTTETTEKENCSTQGVGNTEDNATGEANLGRSLENASQHAVNVHEQHNFYPHIGLEFDSLEDVKNYYKAFAKKEGFGIRIRSSKDNLCILVCSNAGQYIANNSANEESSDMTAKVRRKCSTSRTDCKASVVISKAKNRPEWTIIGFNNDHNHVMVSPKIVNYLRCHKNMSQAAKNLVEKFDKEGLPTGKVVAMFNNGGLSFSDRDCWNHLRDVRSRNLEVGDAQEILNFCQQKQAENPNFVYIRSLKCLERYFN